MQTTTTSVASTITEESRSLQAKEQVRHMFLVDQFRQEGHSHPTEIFSGSTFHKRILVLTQVRIVLFSRKDFSEAQQKQVALLQQKATLAEGQRDWARELLENKKALSSWPLVTFSYERGTDYNPTLDCHLILGFVSSSTLKSNLKYVRFEKELALDLFVAAAMQAQHEAKNRKPGSKAFTEQELSFIEMFISRIKMCCTSSAAVQQQTFDRVVRESIDKSGLQASHQFSQALDERLEPGLLKNIQDALRRTEGEPDEQPGKIKLTDPLQSRTQTLDSLPEAHQTQRTADFGGEGEAPVPERPPCPLSQPTRASQATVTVARNLPYRLTTAKKSARCKSVTEVRLCNFKRTQVQTARKIDSKVPVEVAPKFTELDILKQKTIQAQLQGIDAANSKDDTQFISKREKAHQLIQTRLRGKSAHTKCLSLTSMKQGQYFKKTNVIKDSEQRQPKESSVHQSMKTSNYSLIAGH